MSTLTHRPVYDMISRYATIANKQGIVKPTMEISAAQLKQLDEEVDFMIKNMIGPTWYSKSKNGGDSVANLLGVSLTLNNKAN